MSTSVFLSRWWSNRLHLPLLFMPPSRQGRTIMAIVAATGAPRLPRLRLHRITTITDPITGIVMTMAAIIMAMAATGAGTESRRA